MLEGLEEGLVEVEVDELGGVLEEGGDDAVDVGHRPLGDLKHGVAGRLKQSHLFRNPSDELFRSQTVLIKLVLTEGAQLSIHFFKYEKLLKGPVLGQMAEERKKRALHLAGINPRPISYMCSTAVQLLLPYSSNENSNFSLQIDLERLITSFSELPQSFTEPIRKRELAATAWLFGFPASNDFQEASSSPELTPR